MGATEFGSSSAQAVKRWSSKLARETISKMFFRRFSGKSDRSIIQMHTDLESAAGDEIKYDVLYQNRGDGVQGDTTLEDYEEELEFYQDSVKIDQLRNAVSFRRMSQQRTVHELRGRAKDTLSDWMAWKYDTLMFAYLAGYAGTDSESASGTIGASGFAGNALTAIDAAHLIDERAGGGNSSFSLEMLDVGVSKAKTLNPRIRPVMVNGEPKYAAVLHPYAVHNLKRETHASGITWFLAHARIAEMAAKNPIYTGALGEYNGVVLHESEYIPRNTANDDTYNLFLGAQAGAFAMGNAYDKSEQGSMDGGAYFSWNEQKRDYGNKKGISAGACFGIKRNIFNSLTFGAIGMFSVDAEPSI